MICIANHSPYSDCSSKIIFLVHLFWSHTGSDAVQMQMLVVVHGCRTGVRIDYVLPHRKQQGVLASKRV